VHSYPSACMKPMLLNTATVLIGRFATLWARIVRAHTHASCDENGQLCHFGRGGISQAAVVATLSKGCDLDYIWKWVDHGPAKDAASYYIQASELLHPGQRGRRRAARPLVGPRREGARLEARSDGRPSLRPAVRPAQGP
jgi:hypothetical protein